VSVCVGDVVSVGGTLKGESVAFATSSAQC
jgi:hypothetical protein